MSYNIDSTEVLSGELSLSGAQARRVFKEFENNLAGSNFLKEHIDCTEDNDTPIVLKNVWWCSEGSGRTFDSYKECLAQTSGTAEILLIWEGGDTISGLRVEDGKVTEKRVRFVLED